MVSNATAYTILGAAQEQGMVDIGIACDIFHNEIPIRAAKKMVHDGEIAGEIHADTILVSLNSFAFRLFGIPKRCPHCFRKSWMGSRQKYCKKIKYEKDGITYYYYESGMDCCAKYNRRYIQQRKRLSSRNAITREQEEFSFGEYVQHRRKYLRCNFSDFRYMVGEYGDIRDIHRLRLIEASKMPPPTDNATLRKYAEWLRIDINTDLFVKFRDKAFKSAVDIGIPQMNVPVTITNLKGKKYMAESRHGLKRFAIGKSAKNARDNLRDAMQKEVDQILADGKNVPGIKPGWKELMVVVHEID